MSEEHHLMRYFQYGHLPEGLMLVSAEFQELASDLDRNLPEGSEKSAALRKLLEAKDAAVRSKLDAKGDE